MANKLRIRHKLLISYSLVFSVVVSISCVFIYTIVRKNIETNIQSELKNTTTTILNLVETSASVSIKNYLRGIAEKNHDIIDLFYKKVENGLLTESAAKKMASEILLQQAIGKSGYIYCLDSNGKVVVHPKTSLLNVDVSEYEFVRKQLVQKKGYLEYEWKNPEETNIRPKALYMLYFKPWDWIISVSAYREDFKGLVNVEDFKKSVLDLQFGKTGYAFIIDGDGNAVIHPKLENVNILDAKELPPNKFLLEMLEKKTGEMMYFWKNPDELHARLKLTIYNYLPDFDWIVGSSSYHEEFYGSLYLVRFLIFGLFFLTLLLFLPLTYSLSNSITRQLQNLMKSFEKAGGGDFSTRFANDSGDEIGVLTQYYNRFMDRLEKYDNSLKTEIANRKKVEGELRESEELYRSIMEAAPDPIVLYDMDGKVQYFNPAFEKVFGYSLGDCQGSKMDFVPEENWPETLENIDIIKSGGNLVKRETDRLTKNGEIRNVSISGASYRNKHGQLAGSVIILRDISEKKRLTKRLLDIGDEVRQTIGQDLHDDLCPHLIGTAGLMRVLSEKLSGGDNNTSELSLNIAQYIEEAITKSRNLARGLCPVHLVSNGLFPALQEMAERAENNSGISCNIAGEEGITINNTIIATHLYYIVTEAVTNAIKHSHCQGVTITATDRDGVLCLRVSDDGEGIDRRKVSGGMGMQIMHYRASVIGAHLEVLTEPGEGTSVIIMWKNEDRQKNGVKQVRNGS